jgi:tripartite-type tricarboxylate transporter receptor subunit TctC
LTELGLPNADVPIWFSVQAPASTPKDIIDKLNAKIIEIAATDDMKKRMREISVIVPSQTPAEMAAFLTTDIAANGEVIKAANVKLE